MKSAWNLGVWVTGAVLAVGCEPPPGDYQAAREACKLQEGDDLWQDIIGLSWADQDGVVVSHWRPLYPMSEACLDHMSRDLGVDWDEWDDGAREVFAYNPDQPIRDVDRVLVGLWTILARDLGPLSAELERTDRPPAFSSDIERYLRTTSLERSDSVSAALYMFITESIREVEPGDVSTWTYRRPSGTLLVQDADTGGGGGDSDALHLSGKAGLRHREHSVDCNTLYAMTDNGVPQMFCEPDADGSYGLKSWLAHRMWMKAQPFIAARAKGDHVYGFGQGAGASVKLVMHDACRRVADLSHMDYCFDPEFQEWAGFSLDERFDR